MVSAVGVYSQTEKYGELVHRLILFFFFSLHVVFNDYWHPVHALGYSFIDQSGSTFKVMVRKRREVKT